MKIVCPLSDVYEVNPLISAGADEFYCGILPSYWREHYSEFGLLNRREGLNAQFKSFDSLKEAVRLAHEKQTRVYVTLNGLYFLEHQYDLLQRIIHDIAETNADGLIVTEMGLVLLLDDLDYRLDIHISCGANVFNTEAVEFFKQLGANRIILPRDFNKKELGALSKKNRGVDLEVFMLNTKCRQTDGFCNWYHGFLKEARIEEETDKCMTLTTYDMNCRPHMCGRNFEYESLTKESGLQKTHGVHSVKSFDKACGACDIYDLGRLGINYVKIVERSAPLMYKKDDVAFVKSCIGLAQEMSRAEYIARARELYAKHYQKQCARINCYYPE